MARFCIKKHLACSLPDTLFHNCKSIQLLDSNVGDSIEVCTHKREESTSIWKIMINLCDVLEGDISSMVFNTMT
jgi:hypothetical protein